MKKIIIFIVLLLPVMVIAEEESAKVLPIVPRCVYVSSKHVTIPVEVISQNDGIIDNRLDKYLLGKINNNDNNIKIREINNNSYNIEMDSFKDSNNYSNVYFSLKKVSNTKEYKEMAKVMSFNIDMEFKEVPNKVYILGTDVLLSKNKEVCKKINNYNSKELNNKSIVLNERNYIYIMIIGMLIIVIVVLIKRSDKDAIYKIKN